MNPYLVFVLGSASGFLATAFACVVYVNNYFRELHDAVEQRIAEAKRREYARGYQERALIELQAREERS